MASSSILRALFFVCAGGVLALSASVPAAETFATHKNRNAVEKAFADWAAEKGSFYDLLTDDAVVRIEGQSPNSGTFSKAAFFRDRAKPFQARFSTSILPTKWTIWAVDDEVIVRWGSKAADCDGKAYANSYAYFMTMRRGRATALTMFLDMGAYDDVWKRCQPVDQGARIK